MKVFIDPRSTINYSSYYIKGLYDLFGRRNVDFSSKYFEELEDIDILMAFVLIEGDKRKKIIVDYRDQTDLILGAYQWSDAYAKINVSLSNHPYHDHSKLINIPPSFAINIWNPLDLFCNLGKNFFKAKIISHIKDKNIHLRPKMWIKNYLSLLGRQRLDTYTCGKEAEGRHKNYVFFVSTFWPDCEGTNYYRNNYILTCSQKKEIDFEGGFFLYKNTYAPKDIPEHLFFRKFVPSGVYMDNIKKSLFVFNTPAVHNCHGWKLAEFLSMGKAIISTPLSNDLPHPLHHNKELFIVNNVEELESAIDILSGDKELREKLEKNARAYFDKYVSPPKVMEYILAKLDAR